MVVENTGVNISEDEAALYDRQIRLWGLDAQKRLRGARVLLVGVSGLGAEVAKNIVLSGIKSITLLDSEKVSERDFCNQFLAPRSDVGKNRAEASLQRTQALNPMVEVTADSAKVEDKPDDFFKEFDVICATCCSKETLVRINEITRKENIMFFAGDVFGYYSYMFTDLNEHEYAEEVTSLSKKVEVGSGEPSAKKQKLEEPETVTLKKKSTFCSMKSSLSVDWSAAEEKTVKKTPNTYFIFRIMMEFRQQKKRSPNLASIEEDKATLAKLRTSVLESLKLEPALVPENFVDHCFSELSPVCAVAGGVLGQEIIKAVSQKDQPHNNFFFYNGVEGSGLVDKIGA